MGSIKPLSTWVFLFVLISSAPPVSGQTLSAQQQLAHDIYKELVEINTVTPRATQAKQRTPWPRAFAPLVSPSQMFRCSSPPRAKGIW